ncbi:MAG: hypothetical protein AAGA86_03910 [Bacteroidota bacterium]
MALSILTLGCLLGYGTSKYFPLEIGLLKRHKIKVLLVASIFLLFSGYLFTFWYDGISAWAIWSVAVMTVLSCIILSIKMNTKWIWAWVTAPILFLILELH